ncbi:Alpha-ketoglutarate permease [Sphingopyxis fribergensis]|uniref:Alpha-ketoglutarate permease n=1 Tax=Sphingopyxis fribergensis TaxID=1515612 RepID=A0A0A7PDR1_9SPHN|nr:MFS transporter [Sphingopyxis fribergensis]AJA08094.1 Alpha-ketoglutarate permease [Sphingopyxis fribergensis]
MTQIPGMIGVPADGDAPLDTRPAIRLELDRKTRARAAIAGSAGNLIEWYDFYAYAYTALYFASAFFPEGDRTAQLLNVAAVYAAGFLIRPLGGWYFGRFADRRGRRAAMIASVLLMGAGSLLVAILPTYATIGAAAPALLLVARLMQGFSTGGQYGAAATYLSEIAEPGKRGFYASFQFVTLIGGQLFALLTIFLLQTAMTDAAIREWGWRIPFVLGAVLAGVFILFRDAMHETAEPAGKGEEAGSMKTLIQHPRAMLTVMALSAAGAVTLYTFTTYMQKYLVNTAGMDVATASRIMLVVTFAFLLLQPVLGMLSDRIGRRTNLLIFSGGMTLFAVPLLGAIGKVQTVWTAGLLIFAALAIMSFYTSVSGLFKAELFPASVRALGVGLGHAIASAIFGGTAEYAALLLKQMGHEQAFAWYVSAICAVAFVVALRMKEPRAHGHLH